MIVAVMGLAGVAMVGFGVRQVKSEHVANCTHDLATAVAARDTATANLDSLNAVIDSLTK